HTRFSRDWSSDVCSSDLERLPPKPPSVSFRQIVIAPQATPEAKETARAHAESLLVQLRSGADFAELATRESADPGSAENGGDLETGRAARRGKAENLQGS